MGIAAVPSEPTQQEYKSSARGSQLLYLLLRARLLTVTSTSVALYDSNRSILSNQTVLKRLVMDMELTLMVFSLSLRTLGR